MKFTKVHWFYEVEVNGEVVGSVQKMDNGEYKGLWQAQGNDNWLYRAKTRKEAVENMMNQNRKGGK